MKWLVLLIPICLFASCFFEADPIPEMEYITPNDVVFRSLDVINDTFYIAENKLRDFEFANLNTLHFELKTISKYQYFTIGVYFKNRYLEQNDSNFYLLNAFRPYYIDPVEGLTNINAFRIEAKHPDNKFYPVSDSSDIYFVLEASRDNDRNTLRVEKKYPVKVIQYFSGNLHRNDDNDVVIMYPNLDKYPSKVTLTRTLKGVDRFWGTEITFVVEKPGQVFVDSITTKGLLFSQYLDTTHSKTFEYRTDYKKFEITLPKPFCRFKYLDSGMLEVSVVDSFNVLKDAPVFANGKTELIKNNIVYNGQIANYLDPNNGRIEMPYAQTNFNGRNILLYTPPISFPTSYSNIDLEGSLFNETDGLFYLIKNHEIIVYNAEKNEIEKKKYIFNANNLTLSPDGKSVYVNDLKIIYKLSATTLTELDRFDFDYATKSTLSSLFEPKYFASNNSIVCVGNNIIDMNNDDITQLPFGPTQISPDGKYVLSYKDVYERTKDSCKSIYEITEFGYRSINLVRWNYENNENCALIFTEGGNERLYYSFDIQNRKVKLIKTFSKPNYALFSKSDYLMEYREGVKGVYINCIHSKKYMVNYTYLPFSITAIDYIHGYVYYGKLKTKWYFLDAN